LWIFVSLLLLLIPAALSFLVAKERLCLSSSLFCLKVLLHRIVFACDVTSTAEERLFSRIVSSTPNKTTANKPTVHQHHRNNSLDSIVSSSRDDDDDDASNNGSILDMLEEKRRLAEHRRPQVQVLPKPSPVSEQQRQQQKSREQIEGVYYFSKKIVTTDRLLLPLRLSVEEAAPIATQRAPTVRAAVTRIVAPAT
jgi:hypothetical protein